MQHQQKTLNGHNEKFDGYDKQLEEVAAQLEQLVPRDLHDKQLQEVLDRLTQLEKSLKRSR